MTITILAIGALLVLLVLLAPFWMLFKTRTATAADLPRRRARRGVACVAVVVAVLAVSLSAWSLSVHLLNMLAAVVAFAAAGWLVAYAFSFKPRAVGILFGVVGTIAWCLALAITFVFAGVQRPPMWADLGEGLYCHDAATTILPFYPSNDIAIVRRYGFVDRQLYSGMVSDEAPESPPAPPLPASLETAFARCRASLNRQWEAKAAVANPANRAYTPAVAAPIGSSGKR
jgi:hypothetical protein